MLDKPESGEIWPRWNPFSDGNLPPKGLERDHYLLWIARYIAGGKDENYWSKLAGIALEGLLQFYVSKTEQASANDYFLGKLLDNGKLSAEDRDILLSYYALMPEEYSAPAIDNLQNNRLTIDNYLPVGSWGKYSARLAGKGILLCNDGRLSDRTLLYHPTGRSRPGLRTLENHARQFYPGSGVLWLSSPRQPGYAAFVLSDQKTTEDDFCRDAGTFDGFSQKFGSGADFVQRPDFCPTCGKSRA